MKTQSWGLTLKPCALRIIGTNSNGLKFTQEGGDADEKAPHNSGFVHDFLQPTSSKKCCTPKNDMIFGIKVIMMDKILTMVRCVKIGSMGFFFNSHEVELKMCTHRTQRAMNSP
jgi:hypothetical protein